MLYLKHIVLNKKMTNLMQKFFTTKQAKTYLVLFKAVSIALQV